MARLINRLLLTCQRIEILSRFADTVGPILAAIGRIAWHWTNIGFRMAASGGRTVELSVSGAGQASRFKFRAAPAPKREGERGRPPTRTALVFWLDPDRDARRNADKPALVTRWTPRPSTPRRRW